MRKVLWGLLVLFCSLSALFLALRLTPGDPVEQLLGPRASVAEKAEVAAQLGLDQSVLSQYTHFFGSLLQGDLGESFLEQRPVSAMIAEALGPTTVIALCSVFLALVVGTLLGVGAAIRHGRPSDHALRVVSLAGISIPIFSLGPLLILLFSIEWGLLPVSEWKGLRHAILPILTITIPLSAILSRVARARFLEERWGQWVVTLRAKGLSAQAIYLRIVKAIFPTLLNVSAIQLQVVLGGTIITETIFDIPGLGRLLFEGLQGRDYPVVQGVVAYITVGYVVVFFLFDFLNEILDPRLRRES